jgi:DNA-binding transcriptional ArsR family regulator
MPSSDSPRNTTIGEEEIDPIIHSPARLKILTVLKEAESADFLFILRHTGLTRGNLSSHLSELETANYVTITKEFVDKIPHTLIQLTVEGKNALELYRRQMLRRLELIK